MDHQTNPYFWRDSPSDSQTGVAMALYAHLHGYKRSDILMYTDSAAQTLIKPVEETFTKLGRTIVANIFIQPDQTSCLSEVQQVINTHPQVIFSKMDAQTAAAVFRDFNERDILKIPFINTDISGGSQFLSAITYPVAHQHLISIYGTSVTGQANNVFMSNFNKLYPGQQPLANAIHAYDAVIRLALATDKADSTSAGHQRSHDGGH